MIVPAVPTRLPPSRTITPAPDPTTLLSPDPSPIKFVAVTTQKFSETTSLFIFVVTVS